MEITDNGSRGVAVLKLYGPSKKNKEFNVMVTKSKESGQEYVIILAEKIAKPLMKRLLNQNDVNNTPVKKLVSLKEKESICLKEK